MFFYDQAAYSLYAGQLEESLYMQVYKLGKSRLKAIFTEKGIKKSAP